MTPSPNTAADLTGDEPAVAAWKTILELVGWGRRIAPRFPQVALDLDLSPKQLGVLLRLIPNERGVPMREIAESLYCDASYVTDMVDRLQERRLIERQADPSDRRVKLLALTSEGEALRERALGLLHAPPEGFESLDAEEAEQLARLLARVLERTNTG